jgi:uncharacterized protein GlcG (DUF336 family)
MDTVRDVTLEEAKKILDGALRYAEKHGLLMSFAVVDRFGNLVAIYRMDNAVTLTPDWAIRKAFTASCLRTSTTALADRIMSKKSSYTFYLKSDPRFLYVKGGIPIMESGKIIGAFGASGATDEIDEKCAKEGLRYAGFSADFSHSE